MGERRPMNDDLALGYVLGTLDRIDHVLAEQLVAEDPSFADAVQRARTDLRRLSRDLDRTASRQRRAARLRRLPWPAIVATCAALAALLAGLSLLVREGNRTRARPSAAIVMLEDRIARADLIVVGTVGAVTPDPGGPVLHGPGSVVRVAVEQALKGDAPEEILVAQQAGQPRLEIGGRFLLFLRAAGGTTAALLDRTGAHYLMDADGLVDAPFTLDDLRAHT